MFRTSLLRSAASAARFGVRSPIVHRPLTLSPAAAPRATAYASLRLYSSGGGLDKEAAEGRIMSLLAGFDKVNDPNNINPTAHFSNDLGLDSLDTVEVVMAIEEEFSIEIPDKDADKIHSVEQAVTYITSQPDAL